MHRMLLLLTCVLFTGCVTYGTIENPDGFVNAATSWNGGHIRDMISAWGQPNDGFVEPTEYMHGMAAWKFDEMEQPNPYAEVKERTTCNGQVTGSYGNVNVNCNTYDANASARRGYELGRQAGASFRRRCFAAVQFDESGTIFDVTATSQNCTPSKQL